MNIDNLIDIGFDFDNFKSDCLIHDFLKTYIKKNRIYPHGTIQVFWSDYKKKHYVFSFRV
jgi:hypothetical protein